MRTLSFAITLLISSALCVHADEYSLLRDRLVAEIERRERIDDVHVEVACRAWNGKDQVWNEIGELEYWRNGEQVRWQERNPYDGTITTELWSNGEFWSHQTKAGVASIAAAHELATSSQKPAVLLLGLGNPHVFVRLEDFKRSSDIFQVINTRGIEDQIQSCTPGLLQSVNIVFKSTARAKFEFDSQGVFQLVESFGSDGTLESLVESNLADWMIAGRHTRFPKRVRMTLKSDGNITSIVETVVKTFEYFEGSRDFYSPQALDMPIGHRVNDLIASNLGHWDGEKVILPSLPPAPSGLPSNRNLIWGAVLLIVAVVLMASVWMWKRRMN